jgi:amino acid adenylation domain-containing protein
MPIDPGLPTQRIADMIAEADPAIVLAKPEYHAYLPDAPRLVSLDIDDNSDNTGPINCKYARSDSKHPAYVICTSGTTGHPKAIAVPFAVLVNLMKWHNAHGRRPRVAQLTSPGFDVSLQEILYALLSGGTLVIPDQETRIQPEKLIDFAVCAQITDIFCTATVLENLATATLQSERRMTQLENIWQAGEALVVGSALRRFFALHPKCRLHNHYGPSETHVVTAADLLVHPEDWPDAPSIGTPISNTSIYILDSELHRVPHGVDGEVYVGGEALARGYIGRPALTAERFIANPWATEAGSRMYRTGDIARLGPDGSIEYRGRADLQIKMRGFRIEPSEIEAALTSHPMVAHALVQLCDLGNHEKSLVAYVIPGDGAEYSEKPLRDWLNHRLPSYMVPSAFVKLDSFPMTVNGKVDRAALPAHTTRQSDSREPRTQTERTLCAIFAEVLGVERVGIQDDFFALGGHSLMVARVVSRIRGRLGLNVAVRLVFEAPTVERLADVITGSLEPELVLSDYAQAKAVTRSKPN